MRENRDKSHGVGSCATRKRDVAGSCSGKWLPVRNRAAESAQKVNSTDRLPAPHLKNQYSNRPAIPIAGALACGGFDVEPDDLLRIGVGHTELAANRLRVAARNCAPVPDLLAYHKYREARCAHFRGLIGCSIGTNEFEPDVLVGSNSSVFARLDKAIQFPRFEQGAATNFHRHQLLASD